MEIQDIKAQLSLADVLFHYNLSPDRNHRLRCPWHNDKTPSLQIYPKTNTWTCFSSNCNAGSGDQIDFIMKYESVTKHEALKRATKLCGGSVTTDKDKSTTKITMTRTAILTKYYQNTLHAMSHGKKGKAYCEHRALDHEKLSIGYSGYKVGDTWSKELKISAEKLMEKIGVLSVVI